jgi:hypothetical protein
MSKKNKNKGPAASIPPESEQPPFEEGDPTAPTGSAFGGGGGGGDGDPGDESPAPSPGMDGDAGTIAEEAGNVHAPKVNNGGGGGGGSSNPQSEIQNPKSDSRREVIEKRLAEIARDGGPRARTQQVNEAMKEQRAQRDRRVAEWDREISDMQEQVRTLERVQQRELEEERLLKIELAKLAD